MSVAMKPKTKWGTAGGGCQETWCWDRRQHTQPWHSGGCVRHGSGVADPKLWAVESFVPVCNTNYSFLGSALGNSMWKMPYTRKKAGGWNRERDTWARCHYLHVQWCENVLNTIHCSVFGPRWLTDCPQHPSALAKWWVLVGAQVHALAPSISPCPPHLSAGALSAASEHQRSRPRTASEDTCVNLACSKSWLNRGPSWAREVL